MTPPLSRQDDFQLQLAQWLLDQLNPGSEQAVTQQFNALISQIKEHSIESFYAHVAKLIFQRVTRTRIDASTANNITGLCAELCRRLSVDHFKQHSSSSPRVALVHNHLFYFCVGSLSAKYSVELAYTQGDNGITTEPELQAVTHLSDDAEISLERTCELLSYLCESQLISLAQIYEYIYRVIEHHKMTTNARLTTAAAGVRFLLDSCVPYPYHGPWEGEVKMFREWVDMHSIPEGPKDQAVMGSTGQIQVQEAIAIPEDMSVERRSSTLVTTTPAPPISSGLLSNMGASLDNNNGSLPNPTNDPAVYDVTDDLPQNQRHEEEMINMRGNNLGKPPRSPVTLEPESPANSPVKEKQALRGLTADTKLTEHRPTSPVNFGSIEASWTPGLRAEMATSPIFVPKPACSQESADGINAEPPTFAQSVPLNISAMTVDKVAAPIAPATKTTPCEQRRANEHTIFQVGLPLVTQAVATSTPCTSGMLSQSPTTILQEGGVYNQVERRDKKRAEHKAKKEAKRQAKEDEERKLQEKGHKEAEQKTKLEAELKAQEEEVRQARQAAKSAAHIKADGRSKVHVANVHKKKADSSLGLAVPLANSAWSKGPPSRPSRL